MSNSYSQTKFNHVAIYVKDLKASGDFYSNVLGLEEVEEPFKDGLHLWYKLGEESTLHLIEGPWKELVFTKSNHLCLSVADLDGFIEKLKERDITFENVPGDKNEINVRADGIRQIYFQDPTGYWIEINDEY
jgi:catechol 2,3-dioxygenase-like lactoylglutathione lyase family enzyme